jgi:5-methylcytosine-specific restriction endonuclease McrA
MIKICTKCHQEKELLFFYKRKDSCSGYTSHCKACKRAHDNEHAAKAEIKKVRSEYQKQRRSNPAIKDHERAQKYAYHRMPEIRERRKLQQRLRRLDPTVITLERERYAAYAKANPHLFAAKTRKRKAAKSRRTPQWLSLDHLNQIKMFYKESAEISKLLGEWYEVDHIVPLQGKTVCGLHVPWNLQILTAKENGIKGNRL